MLHDLASNKQRTIDETPLRQTKLSQLPEIHVWFRKYQIYLRLFGFQLSHGAESTSAMLIAAMNNTFMSSLRVTRQHNNTTAVYSSFRLYFSMRARRELVIPMSKYSIFTSAERIVLPVTGDLRS
jgi:hypothetical protein